jgi:hypothetical protein
MMDSCLSHPLEGRNHAFLTRFAIANRFLQPSVSAGTVYLIDFPESRPEKSPTRFPDSASLLRTRRQTQA